MSIGVEPMKMRAERETVSAGLQRRSEGSEVREIGAGWEANPRARRQGQLEERLAGEDLDPPGRPSART
jgi:hypothetical protein